LKLWKTGKYDYIVVSGAKTYSEEIQTKPAGTLMAEWLEKNDVPSEKILIDNNATDSFLNVDYTMDLIKKEDLDEYQITVIATYLHDWRLGLTFRKKYGVKIKSLKVKHKITLQELFGEIFVLFYALYDPLGKGRFARRNREARNYNENVSPKKKFWY